MEKIKLTNFEYTLLKLLPKNYKYICRDVMSGLKVYEERPINNGYGEWWSDEACGWMDAYDQYFQFIKPTDADPYLISRLLKEK